MEWTRHTISLAIKRLDEQYRVRGNERRRQVLALHIDGLKSTEIAGRLALDIETVKNDIRAIKRDSHDALRTTIRATVANDELVEQEMSAMKEIVLR